MKKIIIMISLLFLANPIGKVQAIDLQGVEIHGFISQGFLLSDENDYLADSEDGSFQFNELGISFSKKLTDRLRIGIQFFSRDLGDVGNNEIEVDWAYGDYRWQDWLGLRVGLMKKSHGLYNETRDIDMLRTFVLLPQSVYPEMIRDYYTRMWGGEIYGEVPAGVLGSFSYRFLIGTYTPDADNSGVSKLIETTLPIQIKEYDSGVQYNGGLQWNTPLDGLRFVATAWKQNDFSADIAFNGMEFATKPVLDMNIQAAAFSLEYTWENLQLAAEYHVTEIKSEIDLINKKETDDMDGYYVSLSYRFADWLELGSYYSLYYPDKHDRDGDNIEPDFLAWQKDLAVSARFDINEFWVVKVEGHKMDGAAGIFYLYSDSLEIPKDIEEDWYLFTAKVTFSF